MDGIYPDQVTGSELRRWLDRAETDVLIVGHTHIAFAIDGSGGGLAAKPGALLRDPAFGSLPELPYYVAGRDVRSIVGPTRPHSVGLQECLARHPRAWHHLRHDAEYTLRAAQAAAT